MAVREGKKKKPPTFQYLPKSRAHRLKKSWVEDHKIRTKWKAQKKREGLTVQTSTSVEDTFDHTQDETNPKSELDTSPNHPIESPTLSSSHDKRSLRDLRKIAYASKVHATQEVDSSHPKRGPGYGGKATVGRKTGQPNMELRMNVLLEKIKRDFS